MITFERWQCARVANHFLGCSIDLNRSNPRLNHLSEFVKNQSDQLSGGTHFLQFFLRLPDNHKRLDNTSVPAGQPAAVPGVLSPASLTQSSLVTIFSISL